MAKTLTGREPQRPTSPGRRDGGLTISALRTFVAVVDAGSFTRAAVALGVTQPNISNQITALEQVCGLRLLNRRSHSQSLTDAGRDIYTRARIVLSRMSDLESAAHMFSGLRKGRLTVGFSSPTVALGAIGRLMRAHPEIEVQTRTGNTTSMRQDVLACRVDAAIVSMLEPDDGMVCTIVETNHLALLVPHDHQLAQQSAIAFDDIPALPLILREEGSVTRALVERAFLDLPRPLTPVLTVQGNAGVKEAVVAGIGVAPIFASEAGQDSRLKAVPLRGKNLTAGLYFITLPENLEMPTVAAFAAVVKPS